MMLAHAISVHLFSSDSKKNVFLYISLKFSEKRVNWYAESLFVEFAMKLYVQLMILFVISLIGEGISSFFHLPIPGSIIGLIILFLALQFKWLRIRHVNMVGNFLLANMTILFLPPAVGIMEKFDVIAPYLLPIVLIVFFAAVINIILIALVVQFIKKRYEGDYEERGAK